MDSGTIVLIVLASIIILAAIAIISQALSNDKRAQAEAYSVRMNANASVVARMASRNDHEIDIDSDGILTVTAKDATAQQAQATPQAEQEQPATDDEIKAWQSAADWVVASVAVNPEATQLITGKDFGSGSGYDKAAEVLKRKGWIMTVRGGRNAGAYVNEEIGTVKALLSKVALESAMKSLPRPAQRVG